MAGALLVTRTETTTTIVAAALLVLWSMSTDAGAARARRAVVVATSPPAKTMTPRRRSLPTRQPRTEPPAKATPAPTPARVPVDRPTGFTGRTPPPEHPTTTDAVPVPDRWRLGIPPYDRYPDTDHEATAQRGHWWDPYRQNIVKGDYPLLGQHTFLVATARSETVIEGRRLPIPRDVSGARPDNAPFFGNGDLLGVEENLALSLELFNGNAGFRPRRWELHATTVFNANYLDADENGVVNIDPRRGTDRFDGHIAFQELFADYELADWGPYFDTVNVRAGIQPFVSDARGFLFADAPPGLRLHGTADANRWQWDLAYLRPLDKDTNSSLNSLFRDRHQDVAIATLARQDFLTPGYTAQWSLSYDGDYASRHYDENGFLVRPANIGTPALHTVNVGYFGWTGDGHIDRIGISHAFYWAVGHDSFNPIAGRAVDVDAQMAALELSYDRDWLRFKSAFFWASGDKHPTDGTASGFDAIYDRPSFVGGGGSFWQRQGIKLTGTNVALVNRASLLPSLRSSKDEGQANFVNPGIFIYNLGVYGRLTPKLSIEANVNYLRFDHTEPLNLVLQQRQLPHDVGLDYGVVLTYRPLLLDNIILSTGAAGFTPFDGFRKIYSAATLFQGFASATLTY